MKRSAVLLALVLVTVSVLTGGILATQPKVRADAAGLAQRAQNKFWAIVDPPKSPSALRARLFDESTAVTIGAPAAEADDVIVAFVDYNCGACRLQFQQFDILAAQGRRLRVLVRNFPHSPDSVAMAEILVAAHRQGTDQPLRRHLITADLKRHYGPGDLAELAAAAGLDADRLRAEAATNLVKAQLEADSRLVWELRLSGTPSLIIKDQLYRGWRKAEDLVPLLSNPSGGAQPGGVATVSSPLSAR